MTIEVDELLELNAVEVLEQCELGLGFASSGGLAQVLDDHPRLNLLLNVDRNYWDGEIRAVLLVLTLPDELRIERGIARIQQLLRRALVLDHKVAELVRRDVRALVLVPQRVHWRWTCGRALAPAHATASLRG